MNKKLFVLAYILFLIFCVISFSSNLLSYSEEKKDPSLTTIRVGFTASLYSIGVPPELIGTGRGLRSASKKGFNGNINSIYLHLKEDLIKAGLFLNKDNLSALSGKSNAWQEIAQDVQEIEKIFKIELGPQQNNHKEHKKLSATILDRFQNNKNISQLITLTGHLRHSLG